MPRQKFRCSPDYPYHVSSRCINKEWFDCSLDQVWESFSTHLLAARSFYGVEYHAFVLMNNHFHLLLTAPHANLSEAMCFVIKEVSRDVLHASGRINQTFAERFKRTQIDSQHYFLNSIRYIYQNPLRAGLVGRVENYKYSSLRWILGLESMKFPIGDSVILRGLPITLDWMNERFDSEQTVSIRRALRRPVFKLSNQKKKKPVELSSWVGG